MKDDVIYLQSFSRVSGGKGASEEPRAQGKGNARLRSGEGVRDSKLMELGQSRQAVTIASGEMSPLFGICQTVIARQKNFG
jgi:hypothetical protein